MIRNFRHKGVRLFFATGSVAGIPRPHAAKLARQLARLDAAKELGDMNLPGWGLHPLKGARREQWAVSVSGNWRLTFRFADGDAYDIDSEDYH